MNFFNLKTTCAFCGKQVGLNRRKIIKSNCWICPSCMKKAGGITSVDCFLDTKESIEEKIKNNISNNIHIEKPSGKDEESANNKITKNNLNIYQFNVSGTTFDDEKTEKNRQKIIKNIAMEGTDLGYLTPYNDISNKEMLELYIDEQFWVAGQYIKRTKLEITEYNNETAIKVYISDYNDNYYHIGYVPKNKINDVLKILNDNTEEVYSEFSGGKFKEIYFDDDALKEKVRVNDSLLYGIKVTIKYKKNENE